MFLPIASNGRDVGECIYCGSSAEPLGREHAIPYGLNGPWTLLRASCNKCADITHRFERDALRGLFPAIRAVLGMQTRRRRERPAALPIVLESEGARRTLGVPLPEFPLYLPIPVFPPPGAVVGRPATPGIDTELRFAHIAGPTFEEVGQRHGADFAGARLTFSPEDFARMLAKIALCAGIYQFGVRPFTNTPIRRIILGDDRRLGHWIGGWSGEPMNEAKGLHAMQVRASGSDLHVVLRLFAQFAAPEYHVVLGPADPDFVRSGDWPFK